MTIEVMEFRTVLQYNEWHMRTTQKNEMKDERWKRDGRKNKKTRHLGKPLTTSGPNQPKCPWNKKRIPGGDPSPIKQNIHYYLFIMEFFKTFLKGVMVTPFRRQVKCTWWTPLWFNVSDKLGIVSISFSTTNEASKIKDWNCCEFQGFIIFKSLETYALIYLNKRSYIRS